MKKAGISLVALVITIIVLIILTGTVIMTSIGNNGVIGNTQSAVDKYNKQAVIEDINLKIQNERITKAASGIYTLTMEDITPILETYGTFDSSTLKLTTTNTQKPIEIWLYEIMKLPLEEYATITYASNVLTITSTLPNIYEIEYTTDGGETWTTYTTPVTISEESGIQARLINGEGRVISNIVTVTVTMTLGELLLEEGANGEKVNYGKKINYSVTVGGTTINDWRVWCRATVGGEDYTYIVTTSPIEQKTWGGALPATTEVTGMTQANRDLYNIFKLGQSGYALNSGYYNSRCVADLINNYGAYANTSGYVDGEGNSYVVGAIGGPTIEMLAAGWNGLYPGGNPTGMTMAVSTDSSWTGYKINNTVEVIGFTIDNIYTLSGPGLWISSPSAENENAMMVVGHGKVSILHYSLHTNGVCPAVCLKSNIPVSLDGATNTIMIEN